MLVSKAQNSKKMETNQQDKIAITHAIEDSYLKGIYEGNVNLLRKVYYSGTLVLGDIKGVPYAKTIDQYLEGVRNRLSVKDSVKPFSGTIHYIDVVYSIAVAKLHVKMYDFNYDEFLSFHKIDGKWIIVNKILTDVGQ